MRLSELAQGRDNNFQLIRFLAATAVILFHCYALTNRWTDEPLWRLAPELNLGALGVQCFFVVSGFLVTRSWLDRRRLVQFVAARALRIYPALACATAVSIALAAWSSTMPLPAFLADPATADYAWRTALGWTFRDRLPGAFATNPFPHGVNGSLWTLPIELRLYVVIALAGTIGLVGRRCLWLAALLAAGALFFARPDLLPLEPNDGVTRNLVLLFMLGSVACAWRASLPVSLAGLGVALALVVANPFALGRGALFPWLLAYAVLVVAYHPRLTWRAFNRVGDYSYGLYIYAFPLQQTLVARLPGLEPLALFAWSLPLTLALSVASWHLLEQPALGLKSRFHGKPTAKPE